MQTTDVVAVVTGAASGLGAATSAALVAAGAEVVGLDLLTAIEQATSVDGVTLVATDVTDESQVRDAVEQAAAAGPLRIAVNCAGVAPAGRILSRSGPHDLALFRSVVDVNLIGTFNVLRSRPRRSRRRSRTRPANVVSSSTPPRSLPSTVRSGRSRTPLPRAVSSV